jgi:RNA polymerase sigma factor (sigma-70 family)
METSTSMKARGQGQHDPREPAEAKKTTAGPIGVPGKYDATGIEEPRAGPQEPGIAPKGPGMTVEEIAQVIAGDPEAADRFVDVYGSFLRDLVHKWSMALPPRWRPDEEEMVQELVVAFVAEKRRLLRLWDPQRGTLQAYMRAVARNYYIDLLRRQRRESLLPEPLEDMEETQRLGVVLPAGSAAEVDEALFRKQALGFLEQQCTPEEWKLLWDLEAEEKPVGEVAEQLGVSDVAVYQRKHRLLKRLYDVFQKHLAGRGRGRR